MSHIDDLISEWDTLDPATRTRLVFEAQARTVAENTAVQRAEIHDRAVRSAERMRRLNDLENVENITRLLIDNLDVIAGAAWAPDMADEIAAALEEITRKIDTPPSRVFVGKCMSIGLAKVDQPTYDDDPDRTVLHCEADLYVPEEGRHSLAIVKCRDCGLIYSLKALNDYAIGAYVGKLVSPREASDLLGIPRSTIESWIHRKRILPRVANDRKVYLVDELMELARDRKESAA